MVDVRFTKLDVPTLPTHGVPSDQKREDPKASCTGPVDERVPKKVIFDSVVIPRTHSETDIKDRPLPELRGQVILLIRIRDEGII